MEIYAQDTGINGLVMPEELSKIICDYARARRPAQPVGENTHLCAICFGKRQQQGCQKIFTNRYCKGCYYAYGGGGFAHDNTFEGFTNCIKCGGEHDPKIKGYQNCPLCRPCYFQERKKLNPYIGMNNCECGRNKRPAYPSCMTCMLTAKQKGDTTKADELKKVIDALVVEWKQFRLCQLD